MSTIQLSSELLSDIKKVLTSHDEANADDTICSQYMAAIMAYQLAGLSAENSQKKEMLNELFNFANHVLDDSVAKAPPSAPSDDAFGIWKPE